MIKAKKGKQLLIGLSHKNLELLKAGKPIIPFNLKEVGFAEDVEVLIFSMPTEEDMRKLFMQHIDPVKTILKDDNAPLN